MNTRGRRAEAWTRAALSPPHAHGAPLPAAQIKTQPEDFRVEEELSFAPSGAGPHRLLRVEKRAANTRWVAAELARLAGVPVAEVGYAGLKDRHAVCIQWFSLPADRGSPEFWSSARTDGFRVLESHLNARKLRRGALRGNRFRIRLRHVAWPRDALEEKLTTLRTQGAPNYFGTQRFGRDGFNLDRVAEWLQSGKGPAGRGERGFTLSAARALIFNAVLARRVQGGEWSRLAPGDLASLDGSGSHFRVDAVDPEIEGRLRSFDIHPSGPLWGRGEPETKGHALETELEVVREFAPVAELLAQEGLEQERRALRCAVRELSVESEAATLTLSFMLGRGQFATSVLREICDLAEPAFVDSDLD
jgi:tRNA pseudouridine13 synthase